MTEAEKERAAIVAFLRALAGRLERRGRERFDNVGDTMVMEAALVRDTADSIERGDHLQSPTQ